MTTIYSELSGFYHEIFPANQKLIDYLTDYLQPKATILDIGCGNGQTAGSLTKIGFKVVGSDIDESMIVHARLLWSNTHFQVLDMQHIESLKQTFRCIYCVGNVISYLPNRDKESFIRKVYSMLEPGGLWISQFVNWDAIVKVKHHEFPEKHLKNRAISFYREYTDISRNTVAFRTKLRTLDKTLQENSLMYPVMVNEYKGMHDLAGFNLMGHYRDFAQTPYDPATMTGNVFIYRQL
ncbi:class I SAM-dependent methyltransferase [bacterium]|nr:class I SAM-dependent methyltransferase [bacterium]